MSEASKVFQLDYAQMADDIRAGVRDDAKRKTFGNKTKSLKNPLRASYDNPRLHKPTIDDFFVEKAAQHRGMNQDVWGKEHILEREEMRREQLKHLEERRQKNLRDETEDAAARRAQLEANQRSRLEVKHPSREFLKGAG